jgi:hypothetical protein
MDNLDNEVEKIYSVVNCLEVTANLNLSVFKSTDDFLDHKRLTLDLFIFDSLKRLYSSKLKEHWNKIQIPYKSDKAVVIVERRCHQNLEFILHNLCYFAQGYAIHIFCSRANLTFIKNICGSQINNIHIHTIFENVGTSENGRIEYNNLLKTATFWNFLKEEHILTVEPDTYLLKHIPECIYQYDYVASKWDWHESETEPGGGGLSYRKRSMIIKICELDNPLLNECSMQDSFLSTGLKILGGKYSHNIFAESTYIEGAIGVHQWWTFYNTGMSKKIIKDYLTLEL